MTNRDLDLEQLSPDLADLLGAEQSRPGMPNAARGRLAARLGIPLVGLGPDTPSDAPATPPPSAAPGPAAATVNAAAPAANAMHQGVLFGLTRTARIALLTFVAGGATGLTAHSIFDRYEPESKQERRPAMAGVPAVVAVAPVPAPVAPAPVVVPPVAVAVPSAEPPAAPEVALAPVDEPAPARTHHHSSSDRADHNAAVAAVDPGDSRHDTDLAAERALLETARTALSRGQSDATIEVLSRHAHRFPHGRLVEERESLWVQALVQAGHDREARDRGERFRRQFPSSLAQPVVDAALKKLN